MQLVSCQPNTFLWWQQNITLNWPPSSPFFSFSSTGNIGKAVFPCFTYLFIYFYFFTLPSGNSTNKFWNKRTICYFRISTMTALHMEIRLFYSNEIAELNAQFEVHDPLKWWYMDLFLYITRVNMMHNIFPSLDLWKFSFARFSCLLWIFLFPQCCPKGGFKFYSAPETS